MLLDRRAFLRSAAATSLAFAGLDALLGRGLAAGEPATAAGMPSFGLGELVPDPAGILDLPAGFTYRVISRAGEPMDDGFATPGCMDGMGAFAGPDGSIILVRNHENDWRQMALGPWGADASLAKRLPESDAFDVTVDGIPAPGGTTTLVYDPATGKRIRQWLSLAGTVRNCAGGVTPWGTWLTCEETVELPSGTGGGKAHGWVFEVPATAAPQRAAPEPLAGLGRFYHEAAAVDPVDGAVYLTEDLADGLLYRFVPRTRGDLRGAGKLQALAVAGQPGCDTRNWQQRSWAVGERRATTWIDVDQVDNPKDDLRLRGNRAGAALFARGEGMWVGSDGIYIACTIGGKATKGQIWRLAPGGGAIELFIEPDDADVLENCDNLTVSPGGHLVLCEDSCRPVRSPSQHLVGVTPQGACYRIARNALNREEFAGACFSPDGSTLFVNIYRPGLTLAITGPWPKG